jgi:hypothetical protein
MISALSTNGTDSIWLKIGDSGGLESTGYNGAAGNIINGGYPVTGAAAGGAAWAIDASVSGTSSIHGVVVLNHMGSNLWAMHCSMSNITSDSMKIAAGTKSLSAVLTQLAITTSGGSETFDAGTINIMYE